MRRALSGSVSGSGSPTGIAWSPRRTTTLARVSSHSAASSGLDGRAAEERGPQHPPRAVDADDPRRLLGGLPVVVCTEQLADQLGAEAALALGGGAAAPGHLGGDLRPDLGPQVAVAGAAKARSSSAPSGPASTTDWTCLVASSTWSRSSRPGSGAISSEPRSTRSTPSPGDVVDVERAGRPWPGSAAVVDGGVDAVSSTGSDAWTCGGTSRLLLRRRGPVRTGRSLQ